LITTSILLGAGFLLAWANGANDVSKSVATLVGGGAARDRTAVVWGAFWTGAGASAAVVVAQAMVSTFGRGLLEPGVGSTVAAALATTLAAGLWVSLATRTSLPVSTTHAIVGSLAGVATAAYGPASVQWDAVMTRMALPLMLSPVMAMLAAAVLSHLSRWWGEKQKIPDCVCVGVEGMSTEVGAGAVAMVGAGTRPYVVVGTVATCSADHFPAVVLTVDRVHWLTSGAVSFARGLNDAPKLAVLLLATGASLQSHANEPLAFGVVAAGMTLGSLTGGWRVTRVLAEDVTPMGRHDSFVANAVTALLVGAGACTGLPMSTTHVSSGAIIGLGMASGGDSVRWGTVRRMLAGWVITLPIAAMLGALAVPWCRWLVE
jgi:PiT family inorganic phosphate transporter